MLFRPWPVGYIQAVQSHPLDSEGLVGCRVHFWILPIRLIYQLRLLVVLSVTSSWLHFCGRVDMHSCGRCWDTPDAADFRLWSSVSFFTLYAQTSWFCGHVGILYCWSCFFVSHIMRSLVRPWIHSHHSSQLAQTFDINISEGSFSFFHNGRKLFSYRVGLYCREGFEFTQLMPPILTASLPVYI